MLFRCFAALALACTLALSSAPTQADDIVELTLKHPESGEVSTFAFGNDFFNGDMSGYSGKTVPEFTLVLYGESFQSVTAGAAGEEELSADFFQKIVKLIVQEKNARKRAFYEQAVKSDRLLNSVGEHCELYSFADVTFAEERASLGPSRAEQEAPFSEAHFFFSLSEAELKELGAKAVDDPRTFHAYCPQDKSRRNCNGFTTFRQLDVGFQFPKEKLCDWKAERDRVRDFLAAHLVK